MGENINFSSFAEGVMASQGVEVHLIQVVTFSYTHLHINYFLQLLKIEENRKAQILIFQDSSCIEMMESFIKEKNDLWQEDIHDI